MDCSQIELERIAKKFRMAIENAKTGGVEEEFFRRFPLGQCGITCDLLAQYLIDCGIRNVKYVSGCYHYDYSDPHDSWNHAWLKVDGFVVDITADQFKCQKEPLQNSCSVYVGPMSKFYKLFDLDPQGYVTHNGLEHTWAQYDVLKSLYNIILHYLYPK